VGLWQPAFGDIAGLAPGAGGFGFTGWQASKAHGSPGCAGRDHAGYARRKAYRTDATLGALRKVLAAL
jgi:hypothetical protein